MKTLRDFFMFYATDTCFRIVGALILSHIQTIFLVISVVNNIKLTRREVDDRQTYRRYQFHRVPYVMSFLLCTTLTGLMTAPVMNAEYRMQTDLLYDLATLFVYFCGLFCLYRLEAGLAIFMHLYLCLPIICLGLKYFPEEAAVLGIGVVVDGGLLCLMIWCKKGSKLAKKYLEIKSVWDLDDQSSSDNAKVLTPGRS